MTSLITFYKKSSNWEKILFFLVIFLIFVYFFKIIQPRPKEGFENEFLFKTNVKDVYDDFYADIYDHLVFNGIKNDYEIGEIINKTTPTQASRILDIGCGTGHHVALLGEQNLNVLGIDISPSMINKAKEQYPRYQFQVVDTTDSLIFQPKSFTHILCLYFTLYYIQDKRVFFDNCMKWLQNGGWLVVHLVEPTQFDPILPPGNPLLYVSPQRYAKERITATKIKFTDFDYSSNFQMTSNSPAKFIEKFKNPTTGHTRKHEHILYMESLEDIIAEAQSAGFIVDGRIDLVQVSYEYQYLYMFRRPL